MTVVARTGLIAFLALACTACQPMTAAQLPLSLLLLIPVSALLLGALLLLDHRKPKPSPSSLKAQELLRQQNQHYRQLVDKLHAITWEMNLPDLQFTYVSAHAESMLGYPTDQWLLKGFWQTHLHPGDRQWVLDYMHQELASGQDHSYDFRMLDQHGNALWLRNLVSCQRDDQQHVIGLCGLLIDIHEQKRTEHALRLSEHRFASVFHNCPDIIVLADAATGKLLAVNRTFEHLLGIRSDEALGKTSTELGIWYEEGIGPAMLARLNTQKESNLEVRFRPRRGVPFTALLSARKVSLNNHPTLVVVIRDISELKTVQEQLRLSEQKFSRAFHASPDGLLISRLSDGLLLDINDGFTAITGYQRDQAVQHSTLELGLWRNKSDRQRMLDELVRRGRVRDMRTDIVIANGEIRQVELSCEAVTIEDQPCVLTIARDVSERLSMEASLRQAATVFENTTEGVMITDAEGTVLAVNSAFSHITGYSAAEVVGQPALLLAKQAEDPDLPEQIEQALNSHGHWQGEAWSQRKNGELYASWANVSQVLNDEGQLSQVVMVFSDITPLKHTQARLDHQAHHDPLTGLPNRTLFEARLREALAAQARGLDTHPGALLFVDLDRFKQINDSLGHHIGDILLKSVSERLCSVLREIDTVARHGGDEFIVLLPHLHQEQDAGSIADKLLAVFRNAFIAEDHEFFVSASIGISLFPRDGNDVNSLIKHADAAMYRAKNLGRNRYAFYTSELTADAHQRMALENELRHALERDEFTLVYQPKLNLKNGQLDGVEALVRWEHPQRGLVGPEQFIALAEETGLIVELGRYILDSACAQLGAWLHQGFAPMRLAVNISGAQLRDKHLLKNIEQVLERYQIPPCYLELEITEDFVMDHQRESVTLLQQFRQLGIHLSIDDFGTGYSSMAYLKELPLDTLKIDRSFVSGLPGAQDAAITQSIIVLAHNLGMSVVAEGVERQEQKTLLEQQGCDVVQGYLISRPLPASQFAKSFLRHSA